MTDQTTNVAAPGAAPLRIDEPSRAEQIGFGVGGAATGLFITVPGLVLLYFLTDTLGVAASLAGLVVLLPRLLDIVTNPVVGRLSDSTTSAWGPRRPWILAGGLLFPLAFIAMFWSPTSGNAAALWVGVTFTVGGIFFAAFIVPWSSLPAEIGGSSRARTAMTSWKTAFIALGILLSGGLAPVIVESYGGREGYRVMSLVMAAMMFAAAMVALFVGARRSTTGSTQAETITAGELVSLLRSSRDLRVPILVIALCEIAVATGLTSAPYIADHLLGSPEAVAALFISLVTPLMVTMPGWSRFVARRGKIPALRIAVGIYAAGSLVLAALPFIGQGSRLVTACLALVIMGVGFAGMSMLPQAMLADAVALESSRTGLRQAGIVTGAANSAETIASGIAAAVYAGLLAVSGYISTEEESVTQPESAVVTIVLAVVVISVIGILGVLAVVRNYRLEGAQVDLEVASASEDASPVH